MLEATATYLRRKDELRVFNYWPLDWKKGTTRREVGISYNGNAISTPAVDERKVVDLRQRRRIFRTLVKLATAAQRALAVELSASAAAPLTDEELVAQALELKGACQQQQQQPAEQQVPGGDTVSHENGRKINLHEWVASRADGRADLPDGLADKLDEHARNKWQQAFGIVADLELRAQKADKRDSLQQMQRLWAVQDAAEKRATPPIHASWSCGRSDVRRCPCPALAVRPAAAAGRPGRPLPARVPA